MPSSPSEREKLTIDQKLNVLNPPLSYVRQQNVDRFSIALAVQIPYPLLQLRYNIVSHKPKLIKVLLQITLIC